MSVSYVHQPRDTVPHSEVAVFHANHGLIALAVPLLNNRLRHPSLPSSVVFAFVAVFIPSVIAALQNETSKIYHDSAELLSPSSLSSSSATFSNTDRSLSHSCSISSSPSMEMKGLDEVLAGTGRGLGVACLSPLSSVG